VTLTLVGGDCRYNVWGKDPALTPYGSWSGTRTGTLNATDARDLADDFGYATWPDMAGVYGPDAAVSDFPRFYLFDGEHQVICNTPCDKSAPSVAAAFERTSAWVTRLYDLGNDSDGPLRLRVYEAEDFLSDPLPEWPLAKPAADLTTMPQADPNLIWGPAIELTEAADTAALRGLREQLARRLVQDEPAQARHAAPGMQYLYAFRDSTPFEDSDGNLKGLYEQP
jgi:hypothetical protein